MPGDLRQGARRAQAVHRRQSLARRLRHLRQSDARGQRNVCPGGRAGFDVHPAFNVDPTRLSASRDFVENKFLPKMRALATCEAPGACRDPRRADDLRRSASGRIRQSRLLRARRKRSGLRPRMFLRQGRKLRDRSRRRRPRARLSAISGRAISALMRRARAGSAPPMTAISPP